MIKKSCLLREGRQFASVNPLSGILKHEAKLYNCCSTYIDRVDVFSETMYLFCGAGRLFFLHKNILGEKLPSRLKGPMQKKILYLFS